MAKYFPKLIPNSLGCTLNANVSGQKKLVKQFGTLSSSKCVATIMNTVHDSDTRAGHVFVETTCNIYTCA